MGNITAKLVKDLRDKTGAGMMDCKKALNETEGNVDKAIEWLRQKGIASAEKKSGRVAAEGSIGSYIHTGSRVGVLIEINCETDFVARGDIFQSLLKDVSMQVAACPNVEYVSIDEIPEDVVEKEKQIEMGRDDLSGKPEQIKEKIVEGRIAKRLKELKGKGKTLILFALITPLIGSLLALFASNYFALSIGNATLLMVLTASASYIAVPAVVKDAIPDANPAIYLGLSLGVTFPFNIIIGIPVYHELAKYFIG